MKRKPITATMKWKCLIVRGNIKCAICGLLLFLNDPIEWDHVHEVADQGPNEWWNIRPLHVHCHATKTKIACKQRAHIKRLAAGPKKSKRPMPKSQRKMQSRGFR